MSKLEFPIIAVGASAGGIEALKSLVECLPEDTQAAFVILQHLSPEYESQLTSILDRAGNLPCIEADHDMPIERGNIYVLPPDQYLRIADHGLFSEAPDAPRGQRMPIDFFMRSLADAVGPLAAGVVLSGTGSDGTLGLRAIKGAGGLTFAQSPETALYDGMPKAAIANDDADRVLTIAEIAHELRDFSERSSEAREAEGEESKQRTLAPVISLIRARIGHDFSAYKTGTIGRRVQRRMNLLRIGKMKEYIAYLRDNDDELRHLFDDLLINVTSFFRDAEIWEEVGDKIVAPLLENSDQEHPVRVWVPACATGEEAYTVAMLFDEYCRKTDRTFFWQIFATDLDEDAVATGRAGLYPQSIAGDVSEERLKRYFQQENDGLRIRKDLRERVVFAQQNLLVDPPFSKLDMISCRNLLIYLDSEHQRRLMDTFRFAIREGGFLVLGTSESAGARARHFEVVSKSAHIYKRKPGLATPNFAKRHEIANDLTALRPPIQRQQLRKKDLGERVRQALLDRYAPAGAVVDRNGVIAYYTGPIRRFTELPEGEPTSNLFNMLPATLRSCMREIIEELRNGERRLAGRTTKVRKTDMDESVCIEGMVLRGGEEEEPQYLLTFQTVDHVEHPVHNAREDESADIRMLENELAILREDLQTTVEELETSNEELKASHEEAVAANEELQSANEELETSREELQSLNEELITVNHQLEDKIGEVESTTDDLQNLLTSARLPVLFLDPKFRISNFTPSIHSVVELRDADINRPISELAMKVEDETLLEDAEAVLSDLVPIEKEIISNEGKTFLRRIQPYRTSDQRIGGVVLTFTDISDQAETARRLSQREKQSAILADLASDALNQADVTDYLNSSCQKLAEGMECQFAKVLRLAPDGGEFELVAGTGWKAGQIGTAKIPADRHSQAGFTLMEQEPVLVRDVESEQRFGPPEFLKEHKVRSGISTLLRVDGRLWGILSVHSKDPDEFDTDDVAIVAGAADIVALALDQIGREQRLTKERLSLSLAMRAADLGMWTFDPEAKQATMDDRVAEMFGLPSGRPIEMDDIVALIHGEDLDDVMHSLQNCIDYGSPYVAEFRISRKDGRTLWLSGRGERILRDGKRLLLGVNSDITQRKDQEEQSRFVMRELDHRVKNLLAIILSIAQITGKSAKDLDSFIESFNARLNAISRTHGLLAQQKWSGTSLRRLVEEEVIGQSEEHQVVVDGPTVSITPTAAQSLSMLFHELTTNALKYGALSKETGTVAVKWRLRGENENMLHLTWEERGGPLVEPPEATGFGTKVIKRVVGSQLKAETDLRWEPEGVALDLRVEIDRIRPNNVDKSLNRRIDLMQISRGDVRNKRVMVVDDEWLIAERHSQALVGAGVNVVGPFTDLEEAMAMPIEDLDGAVLDFSLGDGVTIEPLAERLSGERIPIVLVTGYSESVSLPARSDHWIVVPKPASDQAIVDHLALALKRSED
ncbi:chemotaxis protein CheB [Sphingomicrobium arenosum]|uniref:chemotaxis protein CheB n=1 Tax=Sphingomicrobium arenosum TaxID=2233861 RepID=UPI00223F2AB5|nr:chemotaxis protein CheB [Sphingomicrobium arenosum]